MNTTDEKAWSTYWKQQGDADSEASQAVRGESQAEALTAHWQRVFETSFRPGGRVRLLDAACGAGVVGHTAHRVARSTGSVVLDVHACDYSAAALGEADATPATPDLLAVAADARRLPYRDACFDMVVSQYGLEYAGLAGFEEAARVLAPAGEFHAVIHHSSGAIHAECQANLDLLLAAEDAGLLRQYRRLLTLSRRHDQGRAAPQAVARMTATVRQVTDAVLALLSHSQPGAVQEHMHRLLQDLPRIIERRAAYAQGDAEAWIDSQAFELTAYITRMRSMTAASLDRRAIDEVAGIFSAAGLSRIELGDIHMIEGDPPAGWTLSATAP